jgi:predicted nucleic acid-binding protein
VIAIDTAVLIDLLGDTQGAASAERAVRDALTLGPVVACDVVVSEVVAGLGHGSLMVDVLEEAGIAFLPLELRSAVRAGEMQRRYHERLRTHAKYALANRAAPDFLVGAHALLQCGALITRDAPFFRDYFKGLKIIEPKVA